MILFIGVLALLMVSDVIWNLLKIRRARLNKLEAVELAEIEAYYGPIERVDWSQINRN